ncbi:hypothetical protein AVEN_17717-1 [Araneus ventricosus]|uniref:Tc1-like transposase DDE domain-containing protein n=1 Tax=Araneus ventricosus TaxID=182803 RepID=A0A4Y2FD64_ARAVE|nr:hypothetical protein AVEN_17717-1 [Araneus ventricosus]
MDLFCVTTSIEKRACVGCTVFMQGSAPPHIANPVKRLLSMHFENDRIIKRHFPRNWPSRSPDLNPCDFWLWCYLKHVGFSGPIANLAELNTRVAQHIHNNSTDTLRSVVEHAISRFELVAQNGGQHIEHFLSKYRES